MKGTFIDIAVRHTQKPGEETTRQLKEMLLGRLLSFDLEILSFAVGQTGFLNRKEHKAFEKLCRIGVDNLNLAQTEQFDKLSQKFLPSPGLLHFSFFQIVSLGILGLQRGMISDRDFHNLIRNTVADGNGRALSPNENVRRCCFVSWNTQVVF